MKRLIFTATILLFYISYLPCKAEEPPKMVYTQYEVHIYELPQFKGALVLSAKAGLVFQVLEERVSSDVLTDQKWYRIRIGKEKTGWVHSSGVGDDPKFIETLLTKKKEKIAQLEAKAKPIPASNLLENLNLYKQLLDLDLGNAKYQNKVEYYSSNLEAENKRLRSKYDLEILSWRWNKESGYVTAEGQVKNISGRKLERVQALVTWYDKNRNMITFGSSFIEYDPILPDQKSPFRVMKRYNPEMKTANIEFNIRQIKIPAYYQKR